MDDLIICENLVKIYQQDGIEVLALQGLDLHIKTGEMVGIVGASGSGKTTLLNILGGLDRPTAGKVMVEGQDLLKFADRQMDVYRKQKIGFIWQQPGRNLLPYLSALENVMLPMWLAGVRSFERRRRAEELLDSLGLIERKNHTPFQLSGGEQQRTAIAVALANRPVLLLADEPTGEVDSATAKDVYNTLYETNTAFGTTTIIVSHDPLLSQYADRVVTIRDGKTSTERSRLTEVEDRNQFGEITDAAHERHNVRSHHSPDREGSFITREYILLDNAGRLQLPKHILEELNIKDRVLLELENDTVIIRPGNNFRQATAGKQNQHGSGYGDKKILNREDHSGRKNTVRNWLKKTLKIGKNDREVEE